LSWEVTNRDIYCCLLLLLLDNQNMPHCCDDRLSSLERRDLQASIRNQKERNMVLSRLNSELNQELQEVMEQRIALEIQMEHLRPYHS